MGGKNSKLGAPTKLVGDLEAIKKDAPGLEDFAGKFCRVVAVEKKTKNLTILFANGTEATVKPALVQDAQEPAFEKDKMYVVMKNKDAVKTLQSKPFGGVQNGMLNACGMTVVASSVEQVKKKGLMVTASYEETVFKWNSRALLPEDVNSSDVHGSSPATTAGLGKAVVELGKRIDSRLADLAGSLARAYGAKDAESFGKAEKAVETDLQGLSEMFKEFAASSGAGDAYMECGTKLAEVTKASLVELKRAMEGSEHAPVTALTSVDEAVEAVATATKKVLAVPSKEPQDAAKKRLQELKSRVDTCLYDVATVVAGNVYGAPTAEELAAGCASAKAILMLLQERVDDLRTVVTPEDASVLTTTKTALDNAVEALMAACEAAMQEGRPADMEPLMALDDATDALSVAIKKARSPPVAEDSSAVAGSVGKTVGAPKELASLISEKLEAIAAGVAGVYACKIAEDVAKAGDTVQASLATLSDLIANLAAVVPASMDALKAAEAKLRDAVTISVAAVHDAVSKGERPGMDVLSGVDDAVDGLSSIVSQSAEVSKKVPEGDKKLVELKKRLDGKLGDLSVVVAGKLYGSKTEEQLEAARAVVKLETGLLQERVDELCAIIAAEDADVLATAKASLDTAVEAVVTSVEAAIQAGTPAAGGAIMELDDAIECVDKAVKKARPGSGSTTAAAKVTEVAPTPAVECAASESPPVAEPSEPGAAEPTASSTTEPAAAIPAADDAASNGPVVAEAAAAPTASSTTEPAATSVPAADDAASNVVAEAAVDPVPATEPIVAAEPSAPEQDITEAAPLEAATESVTADAERADGGPEVKPGDAEPAEATRADAPASAAESTAAESAAGPSTSPDEATADSAISTNAALTATATATSGPAIVFVLGGPGAGKGTQCAKIKEKCGAIHLSTGDLLRAEVGSGSDQGIAIEKAMAAGELVEDDVTIGLLKTAIAAHNDAKMVLVDGFPRSESQAEKFEAAVMGAPAFVVYLECDEETMLPRLVERGQTSGRVDDNEESIKKRFATFRETSLPVLARYTSAGKTRTVPASCGTVDEVFAAVTAACPEFA